MVGGFSRESNLTILSPAFFSFGFESKVTFLRVGFGGGGFLVEEGFSRESNLTILSPAFFSFGFESRVTFLRVGFGGGGFLGIGFLKKDFTESIIPSP